MLRHAPTIQCVSYFGRIYTPAITKYNECKRLIHTGNERRRKLKKEQDIIKKVCSLLLSLAMVLTMVPVNAFAAEEDIAVMADTAGNTVENVVAEVTADGTPIGQYDSLNDAITAAQERDGSIVKLLADVRKETGSDEIAMTKGTFTVDLNGRTVTRTKFNINSNSKVTFRNGTIDLGYNDPVIQMTGGTLTLENMNVMPEFLDGDIYVEKDSTLTITGGSYGAVDINTSQGGTAQLSGGSYTVIWARGSSKYADVLKTGYIFADESGNYIASSEMSGQKKNVQVIECKHSEGMETDGTCSRCHLLIRLHTDSDVDGVCDDCNETIVTQIGDQYYVSLSEAIAAAHGAEIALQRRFNENVVIKKDETASIHLGSDTNDSAYWCGKTEGTIDDSGTPLTMNGGSVTLKSGAISAGNEVSSAITLNGGTLTIEDSVTKISGGKIADDATGSRKLAIRATGGTLDLQGNTKLEGGLCLSGNATLAHKLQAGIFTNHTADGCVSVQKSGNSSNMYETVFDLLAEGYVFAKYNADGSTGDIITNDASAKSLRENVAVIKCTHKNGDTSLFENGKCTACGLAHKHEFESGSGACGICGQKIVANDGSNYYVSLNEAFAQVEDGKMIDGVEAFPEESLTFGDDKTVTLLLNNRHVIGNADDAATLTVENGNLTIINGVEGSTVVSDPAVITNNGKGFAVSVTGGKLAFGGKATITGGLQVIKGGELKGGLKEGSILIAGTGIEIGQGYSVSVRDHVNNTNDGTVHDLLAPGCAFAKYYKDTGAPGDLVSGYDEAALTEDVIVVAHPTHDMKLDSASGKYICACGYSCPHSKDSVSQFKNGVCSVCGYHCPHTTVEEQTAVCTICGADMAVKVETDENTAYYVKSTDQSGIDDTLQGIFDSAVSGSKITLLAYDLLACGSIANDKAITLDLNGKTLKESMQGIAIDSGSKLTVNGKGASETDTSTGGSSYVFNVQGGTLLFNSAFDEGTFGGIRVGSGTLTSTSGKKDVISIGTLEIGDSKAQISFRIGNFGKIIYSGSDGGSVKLGNLLGLQWNGIHTGNAFKYTGEGGTFVLYNTEITGGSSIQNVTIAGCPHNSVTNRTCDYCGMEYLVATRINDNGSMATYAADDDTDAALKKSVGYAIKGWGQDNGGTLKLHTDMAIEDFTITHYYADAINLNGHSITGGTLTIDKNKNGRGVNLTITDESTGRNGSVANVTVNAGASLTVDSGISGGKITASDKTAKITLKEGSRFTDYSLPTGMVLADWVEDGYCVRNDNGYVSLDDIAPAVGVAENYVVTKASATITANKSGEVEYGGYVPEKLLLNITPTGTSPDYYTIKWYRRTDTNPEHISSGTLKNGTFEYNVGNYRNFKNVNVGDTLDVFCIIKAYKGNDEDHTLLWQTVVKDYKLTVTKGKAAVKTVPTAIADLRYTGSAQELITNTGKADGGEMRYSLDGTNYSADIPQGTDAREYTVWYKAVGDNKHDDSEAQSMKVTIGPMLLDDLPYQGNSGLKITKGYDGTAKVSCSIDGFVKSGGNIMKPEDRIALTLDTDFAVVNARYDNANAGTDKTASMTFVMKNTNYAFATSNPTYTDSYASITKASADRLTKHSGSFTVANRTTAVYTYGLSQLLPELPDPCSYGDLKYTAKWNAATNSVYNVSDGDISIKDGVLTLQIDKDAADANSPMDVGSIIVTVSSTNYDDFDLTIDVVSANMKLPQGEPTLSAATLTYGDTLSRITLSGTMKDGDTTVEGTFAWSNPDAKVGPVGDYAAAWTFTPADTTTYIKTTGVATIKVQKADVTGAPNYTPVTTDGQTLADANLTSDAQNGESLFKASGKAVEGYVKWVDSEDKSTELDSSAKVEQGKAYTWLFTPTDSANYNTLTGTITLWPQSTGGGSTGGGGTSTSGGGGGGAAAPATPDSDVVTEKGSQSGIATKTTIKETKAETTKNAQGQTVFKTIATVSKELAEELVKQAIDHKSDTVEITVTSTAADAASGSAKATELEIPKSAIEEIVAKTDADLVIKTDSGEVALDNKTLQTIAKEAKGDTVTITVSENTRLTKAQNAAKDIVGKNGRIFDLAASIGGKLIHDFDGGKAYITLPMPENIKAQDALVIYIDDNGVCQILNHTVETVGADSYIRFTTTHFSTFAVVEKSEAEDLIQAQNTARVKKLIKNAKFKVTTKTTSKKSVKVTVTPKNDKSLISEIQSMGYTVKYRFYRSTKKNTGYKLLKTKTANTFTNTAGKKGTKYYYKAQVLVYDGKTLIATSALRQAGYSAKIWTK